MSWVVAVVVLVMYFSSIEQVGHDWTSGGIGGVATSEGVPASSEAGASTVWSSLDREPSSEGAGTSVGSSAGVGFEESSAPRLPAPVPVSVSGVTNSPDPAADVVLSGSPASAAQAAARGTTRTNSAIGDLTP